MSFYQRSHDYNHSNLSYTSRETDTFFFISEKLQAEFAEKAGKVAARRRVLQTKAVLGEKQRTAAQVAKNTQQKAAAEVYETDERAEACPLYTSPSPRNRQQSRMPSPA